MPSYDALKNKQNALIRKALDGSVFLADVTADHIAALTTRIAGPPEVISLTALPAEWDDLGWLTSDGVAFSREVSQSTVTSWGSVTPTRTDVTSDVSTMVVVAQETKLLTIGLATGADLSAIAPTLATGGEVSIEKPNRPAGRHYHALSLAVDTGDDGDIYIARYFPRAKVTAFNEQSFSGGDDPITWGVTLTGEYDADEGYSERWIFGGAGWKAILTDMGFPAAA